MIFGADEKPVRRAIGFKPQEKYVSDDVDISATGGSHYRVDPNPGGYHGIEVERRDPLATQTKGKVMTRLTRLFLVLAVACAVLPAGAAAQEPPVEQPILSLTRISLGAGLNYDWTAAQKAGSEVTGFDREWSGGFYGAYNLGPLFSLVASSEMGFDSRMLHSKVGIRVRIYQGAE